MANYRAVQVYVNGIGPKWTVKRSVLGEKPTTGRTFDSKQGAEAEAQRLTAREAVELE
jgi:hypothetical protein